MHDTILLRPPQVPLSTLRHHMAFMISDVGRKVNQTVHFFIFSCKVSFLAQFPVTKIALSMTRLLHCRQFELLENWSNPALGPSPGFSLELP